LRENIMGSDISRDTFDAKKRYSGVRQQQGRVSLDADWNEQVDIAAHRVETETCDVIGASGAPRDNAGFAMQAPGAWTPSTNFAAGAEIIDSNGKLEIAIGAGTSGTTAPIWPTSSGATVSDGTSGLKWQLVASDLAFSAGRMYVDGILGELNGPVTYLTQPDYPAAPPLPAAGTSIVYLDVWERTITALEDPQILEVALGGPDTTTRTKTVWQIKLVDISSVPGVVACSTSASAVPPWQQVIRPSAAQLTTGVAAVTSAGPCCLSSNTGYTGMENQFYRVQIHSSGVNGWKANTPYLLGAEAVDSNGNLERVIAAGSTGATTPAWPAAVGGTVADGTVTWQFVSKGYRPLWAANTAYAVGAQVVDSNGNLETAVAAGTSGVAHPAWPTKPGAAIADGSSGLMWQYATPTFKWSRDNASVATAVTGIVSVTNSVGQSASQLSVASLGRDQVLGFAPGNWVEITDDWQELHRQPGELHQIDSIDVTSNAITLNSTLSSASFPTTSGQTDPSRHTRLTRWDQSGKVYQSDGATVWADLGAAGSTGDIPVPPAGTTLLLENGITVAFSSNPVNGPLYTGDFWNFAARTANGSVELLNQAYPRGTAHHYCRLGIVNFSAKPWTIQDCRAIFPPAAQRPGIQITQVLALDGNGSPTPLLNDMTLPVTSLLGGIKLLCDNTVAPASIRRPTCWVNVEWPNASGDQNLRQFYMPMAVPADVGAQGNVIFWRPQSEYATGNTPAAVAVGDFNGDGNVDMAIVNQAQNTVSVLLGNGDGTFAAHVDYATGNMPVAVAAGDFNGDGKLDLAVVNKLGNSVSILLGNGDGTFKPHADSAAGSTPVAVAAGDFNGDGKLDLAVVNNTSPGAVSVLLGNGDGTFKLGTNSPVPPSYATGNAPVAVAVGDFNRDGIPDLAVANHADNTVSVLLGNGDGTFAAALPTLTAVAGGAPPAGTYKVATTYVTARGESMLSAAGSISTSAGNDMAIQVSSPAAWGNATGWNVYFTTAGGSIFYKQNASPIAIGTSSTQTSAISTTTPAPATAGSSPIALAVADFNGDGKPDLAVLDNTNPGAVSILPGNGDGTFAAQVQYATTSSSPGAAAVGAAVALAIADFNGDGKPDLAVVNSPPATAGTTSAGSVSILMGKGDGTFQPYVAFAVGETPVAIVAADFSGDGNQDLAVVNQGNTAVSILPGNGDGTFQPRVRADWLLSVSNSIPLGDKGILARLTLKGNFIWSQSDPQLYLDGDTFGVAQTDASGRPSLGINLPSGDGRQGGDFQMWFWLTPAPELQISPASLNFGTQVVGTTSAAQAVTLTNVGNIPITISTISITADFAETNTCIPAIFRPLVSLPIAAAAGRISLVGARSFLPVIFAPAGILQPGASCTINVTFTPPSAGAITGTLTINDNATSEPGGTASPHLVSLSGTGVLIVRPVGGLESPLRVA
jgi:hypothetical protein